MAPADDDETVDWAGFSYNESRRTESTREDKDIDELSDMLQSVVVYHSNNMIRVDALTGTFSRLPGIPVGVVNADEVVTPHIFTNRNDVFVECYDMCVRSHNYKIEQ
ncbi:hypothetical protein IW141_002491 [Coemansia sp. RSA 355]|nr:hypothetical protein IW141_002491 [Coemansia sp. RSA 355]